MGDVSCFQSSIVGLKQSISPPSFPSLPFRRCHVFFWASCQAFAISGTRLGRVINKDIGNWIRNGLLIGLETDCNGIRNGLQSIVMTLGTTD